MFTFSQILIVPQSRLLCFHQQEDDHMFHIIFKFVIFLQLFSCFYGQEDFLTGVKYKLPVVYPIDDNDKFTEEIG